MREVFQDGLKKWNRLPAERRKPGAVKVGDPGRIDANYGRKLPEDGLILTAYTRILDRDKSGGDQQHRQTRSQARKAQGIPIQQPNNSN